MKLLIIILGSIISLFVVFGYLFYKVGESICTTSRCGNAGNDRGYI